MKTTKRKSIHRMRIQQMRRGYRTNQILLFMICFMMQGNGAFAITTIFHGFLSYNSLAFAQYNSTLPYKYFQAYRLTPSTSGYYTIVSNSSLDTYGYLYNTKFDPKQLNLNLIVRDDDSGGSNQFRMKQYLSSSTPYILVVTTYSQRITGFFSININGSGSLSYSIFTPVLPSTIIPTSTATPSGLSTSTGTSGSMTSTYSGYLSNSQRFARPSGSGSYYYYQALRIQVYGTGTYSMTTSSFMDTYGCLYDVDFDPSNPTPYSVICDDYSGASNQFLITSNLVSGRYYTLVVTTFAQRTVGSYTARITGPSQVGINSYIPSTSRPIQTTTPRWDYDFDSYAKLSTTAIIAIVCSVAFFIIITLISAIAAAAAKRNRRFVVQTGVTAVARPPTVYRPNQQQVAYVGSPPSRAPVHVMEEQPPSYTELNFNEQKY